MSGKDGRLGASGGESSCHNLESTFMKYDEHVNGKLRDGLKKAVHVIVQQLTIMMEERMQLIVDERLALKFKGVNHNFNNKIDEL